MESVGFLLWTFVLMEGSQVVLASLRSNMNEVTVIDASDVTWAHAVNSWDALEKALSGPIDFLEADISLGHVEGEEVSQPVPIMAHPPETTSDISLDSWLRTVITRRPEKGIKLDFKSIEVVEPSLIILLKYSSMLNSSVWLNADLLSGPVDSQTSPVHAEKFLALCHQYFPDATLSIGWTTTYPEGHEERWHYDWRHAREMADLIRCRAYETRLSPKFTFPVRGIFASRSLPQLHWLLSTVPNSTLTVWSGRFDPLKLEDLLQIRTSFPNDKVYYDLPETNNEPFQKEKISVVNIRSTLETQLQWMVFTRGQQGDSCSSLTYAKNDIIVFGKSVTTTVLLKNVISPEEELKVTGKVKFFGTDQEQRAQSEMTIVLADVSLFSKSRFNLDKFDLTISDTDVIWSAINSSSGIYTFQNLQEQEDLSCRLFRLDTSRDRSFGVWKCDQREGKINEKEDISEISSSRRRLVLPDGPFMLGFVSSGDEHAVIYDLKVETLSQREASLTSGSEPTALRKTLLGISMSALCLMLL